MRETFPSGWGLTTKTWTIRDENGAPYYGMHLVGSLRLGETIHLLFVNPNERTEAAMSVPWKRARAFLEEYEGA